MKSTVGTTINCGYTRGLVYLEKYKVNLGKVYDFTPGKFTEVTEHYDFRW